MAFPIIAGVGGSNSGGNVTTTTVDLVTLAGVPVDGDLWVVIIVVDSNTSPTWPSGWTSFASGLQGTALTWEARYRRYVSGDATSIGVTHSSQGTAWQVYRLANTAYAPLSGGQGSNTTSNPDPGTNAPNWSTSWDTLFIAVAGCDDGTIETTAAPATYSNLRSDRWNDIEGVELATATRELNAASENPGAFTRNAGPWSAMALAVAGVGAGFPRLLARNGSDSGGNVTTSTVNISAAVGAPIVGDLLIITITKDGTGAFTWPASPAFTQCTGFPVTAGGGTNSAIVDARYRISTGDETTCAITHASESTAWHTVRIAADSWSGVPESQSSNGNSTNPDPPSLSPSWGLERTLWIVVAGNDGDVAITAGPSGYFLQNNVRVAASTGSGSAFAVKESAVATEDPGTFTMSSEQWGAGTIAVRQALDGILPSRVTNYMRRAP